MQDYSGVLSRMASAAETIASSPSYFWIPPLAVLFSAAVGYWAARRTIRVQQRYERDKERRKRELVFKLLKNEIESRWQGRIKKALEELLAMEQVPALRRFSGMTLRNDDLFVIREVSTSFHDYYFFESSDIVSQIIQGHLLYADLRDFQLTVKRFFDEPELRKKNAKSPEEFEREEAERLKVVWKRYQTKLQELNSHFQSVLDLVSEKTFLTKGQPVDPKMAPSSISQTG